MAERYHDIGNGIWQGCESCNDCDSFFDEKDIVNIFTELNEQGLYNVAIRLKDGRIICPDYTSYGTRASADQATEFWRSILINKE